MPVSLAATIAFRLHTIVAILVRLALTYTLTYFLHHRTMQYFFDSAVVEITQHVGIACTAGFDITAGIDMQPTPWGCAKEIGHAVFTCPILSVSFYSYMLLITTSITPVVPLNSSSALPITVPIAGVAQALA